MKYARKDDGLPDFYSMAVLTTIRVENSYGNALS